MQASLVTTRLAFLDIFAARDLSLRVLVTVVAFPPPIHRAELPTCRWPKELRTAA